MTTNLLVAFLCLVWGGTWVVIKIGLEDSPPFLSATLRFVVAVVVLGAIVFIGKKPHPRGRLMWWWTVMPGVFMYAIPYASVYWAAQYIPAALNSILFATFPFFVAIFAHFYLPNERLNPIKWLGLFGGFLGVVIIFNDGLSIPGARVIPAMILALVSPAAASVASVWAKKYLGKVNSSTATFYQMSVGVLLLLPLGLGLENPADFQATTKAVGAVIFLGIFGSALSFVIYLHLLKTVEATRLSLIAFVTPIVTLIIGWIVLGEQLGLITLFGGAVVLSGIYCVLFWSPRYEARKSSPT